jgi:hypothetical protein
MTSIPVWLVALVLAALAPWAARALETVLVRRQRRRTLEFLAQALPEHDEGVAGPGPEGEEPPP